MSKLLILFLAAILAVLILTGIVEIKFHPQEYVNIPALTNNILNEKTTLEKEVLQVNLGTLVIQVLHFFFL